MSTIGSSTIDRLPEDQAEDPQNGKAGEEADERRAEPVVFLPLVQHHLKAPKPRTVKANPM